MENAKITIQLVTWNSARYLPPFFESLRAQTYDDWDLTIVDNASTDETAAMAESFIAVRCGERSMNDGISRDQLIKQPTNTGFAGGHNAAFAASDSRYFLVVNPDIYLAPDCLQKLVETMDKYEDVAVCAPKLLKWQNAPNVPVPTDAVDSLGLKVFRSRRVVDAKSTAGEEVFGVSGACALFCREAARGVISGSQLFDEFFGSYKEDVDLAWRLRQAGHRALLVSRAIAYHDRTGDGPDTGSDLAAAANKNIQPRHVRYHSYKNHLMTLYKNEYWQNFLLDAPWILWYEIKKLIYFALFDRAVLAGLAEIWRGRNELKNKRAAIVKIRKLGWKKIRRWYV